MTMQSKPGIDQLRIGRFFVRRWLGGGLQGKVFQAFDPDLERLVAIKWLRPAAINEAAGTSSPYPSEARIVAKLEHPNIVPLYEAGMFRGFPYLVFAYVDGTTLAASRAQGGAMPSRQALALFKAIVDGVACAHAQGILHLDLSPGNILIDAAGTPHVMDFGLAKFAGRKAIRVEGEHLVGTPRYMSPEHFQRRPLTARSDVFALGLILFELVVGRTAVQADSLAALIDKIANRQLDLDDLRATDLSEELQALIRRALHHDAAKRFADAGELKLALEEALGADGRGGAHSTVEFLLNRMQRKANFPALSNNLLEINRLTDENSRASVNALANVVLRDYAITNKILKLANSSFYGRANEGVRTVSDAIRILGMNVVRMTCNGLAYFGAMKGGDANLKDALTSSFVSALIARHFAIRLGRRDLAEEAFICGMFHRLGKSLTIFYFAEEFGEIEALIENAGLQEEDAAARILGIGYGELGRAVAARWKFPDTIQSSIRSLAPGVLPEPQTPAETQLQIAAFANELCELAATAPAEQGLARLEAFAARFAGLVTIDPGDLIESLHSAFEKLAGFAPVLGLDIAGSRFVIRVEAFLLALRNTPAAVEVE